MQFDLGVGHGGHRRLRQADFKLDRGLCRVDAEIGQRGMPHVGGDEGEQPQHDGGGQAVSDDVAETAMAGPEIHGQHDGHRQRGCDAG